MHLCWVFYFFKKKQLAYASIQHLERRWNTIPAPFVFRFVASLPLCYFGYSLVGFDALRSLDFAVKARRDPISVLEYEATSLACANDIPPYEFAL